MRKVVLFALLFLSMSTYAQEAEKNVISIPASAEDVTTKAMISNVIFNNILSGKLKVYSNQECTKLMALKAVKKACTDTVRIPLLDKVTGDIIGSKKLARMYEPDLFTKLHVYTAKSGSGKATFGYLIPVHTESDIIIGYKTMGYLKYDDLNSIIVPFEKKNYSTGFDAQMKGQL